MSASAAEPQPDGQRRIIAYSLWGDSPKYVQGALDNARIAPAIYPDWACRFYVAPCVPAKAVAELRGLPGVEVVQVDEPGDRRAAFWRFRAGGDADLLMLRDADNRLNFAEKAAVDAWLASGLEVHTYGSHSMRWMAAGTTILRGQALRNMTRELALWEPRDFYGDDELFLYYKCYNDAVRRGQVLYHESSWGYGEPCPQITEQHFEPSQNWYLDSAFALVFPALLRIHPGYYRYWPATLGARLCQAIKAVHRPSGRFLAYLLWRLVYGLRSRPYKFFHFCAGRWAGYRYLDRDRAYDKIRESLPQVELPRRGVIAFGLASGDENERQGALDNARKAALFYPGWIRRFYAHASVPQELCDELAAVPDTEVVRVAEDDGVGNPDLWGLAAAGDCDVLLLRSPLGRLNMMEAQAVAHWLASGKDIHSLHDHPEHRWDAPPVHLAGLRGEALARLAENGAGGGRRLHDLVREMPGAWLRHDRQWNLGTPLPTPRIDPRAAYHGMVWKGNGLYAGLVIPSYRHYMERRGARRHWKFAATWLARQLLRPLPERAATACMVGLCRLLYGGPPQPQALRTVGGG